MENLIEGMRQTLGTAFALYVTTHCCHWNVEGPTFYEIHKMLEDQYNDIWESLDDIAEHLRQLDAYTPMSMNRFIELSRIPGAEPAPIGVREMMLQLMTANEIMIDMLNETLHMAEDCDQQGIVNFLAGRIEKHQKHRWMLRASAKPVRMAVVTPETLPVDGMPAGGV
jgi:starvation-inducible DNA-binding protein